MSKGGVFGIMRFLMIEHIVLDDIDDFIMQYYKVITRERTYCIFTAPSASFCKMFVILHYAVLQSDYTRENLLHK